MVFRIISCLLMPKLPLDVLAYHSDEQSLREIKSRGEFTVGFLVWWQTILLDEIISVTKLGFVNVHNSFLTYTKGKYPDFWALTEGYAYGTALQQVGPRQDSGTILDQKEIVLDETDTAETICKKSLKETASLICTNFRNFFLLNEIEKKQNVGGTSHFAFELERKSRINSDQQYVTRYLRNVIWARIFDSKKTQRISIMMERNFKSKCQLKKLLIDFDIEPSVFNLPNRSFT